jgi:hypothetical protein
MRPNVRAAAAAFVAVIVTFSATACGGAPDARPADGDETAATVQDPSESPSASASEETETELPSDEDVAAFFEAMASKDPFTMEQVKKFVERGSLAEAYLGYYMAVSNAAIDGGQPNPADNVTETDEGYEVCASGSRGKSCSVWGDVEGRDGKIVNFTVDGQELGPRISSGNGKSAAAGGLAEVTFLHAYKSIQSGNLFVCSEVQSNDKAIDLTLYGATYRDPTGRQAKSSDAIGPTDLAPKSRATVCQIFTAANPGGDVTFEVWEREGGYANEQVTFPTR